MSGDSVGEAFNHRNEPGISGTYGRTSGEYAILTAPLMRVILRMIYFNSTQGRGAVF